MVIESVKEQIVRDPERLSPADQRRAADLVRGLTGELPKGASVEDLMELAGTLDDESARQMVADRGRLRVIAPAGPGRRFS